MPRWKPVEGKTCNSCGTFKTWDLYHRSGSYPNGTPKHRPDCKSCCNQKRKEEYQSDPDKFRDRKRKSRWVNREASLEKERAWRERNPHYHAWSKYRLTSEQYEKILGDQGGSCANIACGATENLVVDHCHDTGVVRGILCSACNSGLGMLKDNQDKVLGIYKYLKEVNRYGPKAEGKRPEGQL